LQGKETLDTGVKVEKWLDKHYITALDADVVAEWYFTGIFTSNSFSVIRQC